MAYETLYEACLNAVKSMGKDIKTVSWFKRNWSRAETVQKKAA